MSQSCPPLSLDSGVLLQALVDGDRIRKAKELAEQKDLAAAKTDLQRALVHFMHRIKDYYEQWDKGKYSSLLGRIMLGVGRLVDASTQLAAAVKRLHPTMRTPELVRLGLELNRHSAVDRPLDEMPSHIRKCIDDAIVFARELELTPESPSEPRRKRSTMKSGLKSSGYDMQACEAAARHSKAGRPWTITSIAEELGVSRSALNGKDARGDYRCPRFMSHAKQRGRRPTLGYREAVDDQKCNE